MTQEEVIWRPGEDVAVQAGEHTIDAPASSVTPRRTYIKARIWYGSCLIMCILCFLGLWRSGVQLDEKTAFWLQFGLLLFFVAFFTVGLRKYSPSAPIVNPMKKEIRVATEGGAWNRPIKAILALQVVPIWVDPGRWWRFQLTTYPGTRTSDRSEEQFQLNVLTDDDQEPRISFAILREAEKVRELAGFLARAMQVPLIDQIPLPRDDGDSARV